VAQFGFHQQPGVLDSRRLQGEEGNGRTVPNWIGKQLNLLSTDSFPITLPRGVIGTQAHSSTSSLSNNFQKRYRPARFPLENLGPGSLTGSACIRRQVTAIGFQ
jgi:hypothetical protein